MCYTLSSMCNTTATRQTSTFFEYFRTILQRTMSINTLSVSMHHHVKLQIHELTLSPFYLNMLISKNLQASTHKHTTSEAQKQYSSLNHQSQNNM
ncbi:hypothetical protein YC2023_014290 [Brassica napus]